MKEAGMVIHTELIRKQTGFPTRACRVDKVVTLSEAEFAGFTSAPMEYHDLIRDFNREDHVAEDGMFSCLLVLEEQGDDGILIAPQGYGSARDTAYIPNARQMMMLLRYPVLARAVEELAQRVDSWVRRALDGQQDGQYSIALDGLPERDLGDYYPAGFFSDMLIERPEFARVDTDGDGIIVGIAPEYIRQENSGALKRMSQAEAEVLCAKHTLWLHGAGGEQADFSGCLLDAMDLSGWNLAHAVFHGTEISNTNLNGADLSYCQFQGASFRGCECSEVTARGSEFQDAEFISTALDYSVFEGASLSRARFRDCPSDGCILKSCCIDGADFGGEEREAILFKECCPDEDAWLAAREAHRPGLGL